MESPSTPELHPSSDLWSSDVPSAIDDRSGSDASSSSLPKCKRVSFPEQVVSMEVYAGAHAKALAEARIPSEWNAVWCALSGYLIKPHLSLAQYLYIDKLNLNGKEI